MAGQAQLPVMDTINSAWEKVSGSKASFWGAIGVLAAIMFCIGILEGITERMWAVAGLIQIVGNIVGYFLQLGLVYMGLLHARGASINYKMLFNTFDLQLALRVIGLYILQTLIYMIPVAIAAVGVFMFSSGSVVGVLGILITFIGIIGIVVLTVRLSLAIAFVLDAGAAPLDAIKKSLANTDGHFWSLLGIFLLMAIIVMVSMIPVGIGLIWTLPMSLICYGLIYNKLRGNA